MREAYARQDDGRGLNLCPFAALGCDGWIEEVHISSRLVWNNERTALATTGDKLENQSANGLRLVLPGRTRQSIRPFKAVWSFDSHFPVFAGTGSCDRHPPVSRSGTQRVLNTRHDFSAQFGISEILQFNRDSHGTAILSRWDARVRCKPGQSKPN